MERVGRSIDLDKKVLCIPGREARKQRRFLKSLLEYTIEETGLTKKSPIQKDKTLLREHYMKMKKFIS